MAKERIVNTRFWNDGFVSQLDPTEKLLFIYFITNEHTNISGVYEIPPKIIAVETGLDVTMLDKIVPRLKPKIFYEDSWVIMPNFPKHQHLESEKVKLGIARELSLIPRHILEKLIPYGYPMDTLSYTKLNLTKLTVEAKASEDEYSTQPINDEGEPTFKRKGLKNNTTQSHFSFSEQMERLKTSPVKAHNIAWLYFKEKEFKFTNQDQWEPELARTIKSAKLLKGYSGQEIKNTIEYCRKEWPDLWTIETLLKRISEANK